jgi:hypothetical protein
LLWPLPSKRNGLLFSIKHDDFKMRDFLFLVFARQQCGGRTMTCNMRTFIRMGLAVLLGGAGVVASAPARAESSKVISVEEHWELQLSHPDEANSAPQTTMVMSPTGDISGTHFLFTLNHSTAPDYQPGGMQVQVWDGEELATHKLGNVTAALQNSDEWVHWTQRISLHDGNLTFQVVDGQSETWPTFGGDDLSISVPSSLTALNSYRPSVSLGESQVGFAENRVTSLTLKKLVWVTEDGVVHEQNAPIPIDISLGD